MKNMRKYGNAPFTVAVIHGGPGAPGEMAPVAQELSSVSGIIEPLQTAVSLEGQIQELEAVLKNNGRIPVTLIGFSWGAMLSFIFTAQHPLFVKKLIFVGSGVYDEKYASEIMTARLSRLSAEERAQALSLMGALNDPVVEGKDVVLTRFGKLISKADSYDPLPENEGIESQYQDQCQDQRQDRSQDQRQDQYQYQIYKNVWGDAEKLRHSGKLLELGEHIRCPVLAIHGDYDPHPAEGIRDPLSSILSDFRFITLENCGHRPWIERAAKDRFYGILKKELE